VAAARAVPCAGHVRARRDGVRALRARRRRVRVPGDRAGVVAVQERQRRRVRLDRAGGGPPAAGARRVAEARRAEARGDAGFGDEPERGCGAVHGADRRGRAVRVRGRGQRRRSALREEPELRRRRGASEEGHRRSPEAGVVGMTCWPSGRLRQSISVPQCAWCRVMPPAFGVGVKLRSWELLNFLKKNLSCCIIMGM
jgi:hypothetical protein